MFPSNSQILAFVIKPQLNFGVDSQMMILPERHYKSPRQFEKSITSAIVNFLNKQDQRSVISWQDDGKTIVFLRELYLQQHLLLYGFGGKPNLQNLYRELDAMGFLMFWAPCESQEQISEKRCFSHPQLKKGSTTQDWKRVWDKNYNQIKASQKRSKKNSDINAQELAKQIFGDKAHKPINLVKSSKVSFLDSDIQKTIGRQLGASYLFDKSTQSTQISSESTQAKVTKKNTKEIQSSKQFNPYFQTSDCPLPVFRIIRQQNGKMDFVKNSKPTVPKIKDPKSQYESKHFKRLKLKLLNKIGEQTFNLRDQIERLKYILPQQASENLQIIQEASKELLMGQPLPFPELEEFCCEDEINEQQKWKSFIQEEPPKRKIRRSSPLMLLQQLDEIDKQ